MSVHLKTKHHVCELCNFSTSLPQALKQHIKAVHEKIRDKRCTECEFTCSNAGDLLNHIKSVHREKRLKCDKCNFEAIRRSRILEHMRCVHGKIKDQKCPHCSYATGWRKALKDHINSFSP